MKQQTGGAAAGGKPVPHLVFVGSGSHLEPDIKPWPSYAEADGGVIAHYGHRDNFPTGAIATAMYATSKLMLQYAVEEVSKLARGSDGEYVACYPFFPLTPPSLLCFVSKDERKGGGGDAS